MVCFELPVVHSISCCIVLLHSRKPITLLHTSHPSSVWTFEYACKWCISWMIRIAKSSNHPGFEYRRLDFRRRMRCHRGLITWIPATVWCRRLRDSFETTSNVITDKLHATFTVSPSKKRFERIILYIKTSRIHHSQCSKPSTDTRESAFFLQKAFVFYVESRPRTKIKDIGRCLHSFHKPALCVEGAPLLV